MRDSVDKINSGLNQQPVKPANIENTNELKEEQLIAQESESPKEITDLANMPSEVLGRSQIAKDDIEHDMKIMIENPDMVEKANKFYEMAENVLKQSGSEHPAEEAAILTEAFRKEFLS
jgi:hypothetical protein